MKEFKLEIKWGIYFMIMSLLWMLLEKLSGLHGKNIALHPYYTNLIAIPAILIYVFAFREKRKKYYHGKMTYRQGFAAGLGVTVVYTVLSPLSIYFSLTVITPEFFQNAIAYAVENGKMTQEAAEHYFSLRSYMMQGVMGAPIMGIITSAIVALFTKKS